MARPRVYLFSLLLLATVLPHSLLVAGTVGSIIVLGAYVVFGGFIAIQWWNGPGLLYSVRAGLNAVYPTGLACLLFIALLYAVHVALGNYVTITNALSGLIIPTIVVFNFVYVPRVIPPEQFLRIVSVVTAVFVVIGGAIHFAVAVAIVPTSLLWQSTYTVPVVGNEFVPMMSITSNPNILGRLAFVGAIASLALFDQDNRTAYGFLFGITSIGLLVSVSRSSWIAATVAFAVYISYTRGNRTSLLAVLMLLAIGVPGTITLLIVLNRMGYPFTIVGRIPLWEATAEAIARRPYIGHGLGPTNEMISPYLDDAALERFGPHNSYLRMFLHLGILGGSAYLVLSGWAFLKHLRQPSVDIAFVAIASGFLVSQLLESHTMYDIASHAVIMTIVFGYLVVSNDATYS